MDNLFIGTESTETLALRRHVRTFILRRAEWIRNEMCLAEKSARMDDDNAQRIVGFAASVVEDEAKRVQSELDKIEDYQFCKLCIDVAEAEEPEE